MSVHVNRRGLLLAALAMPISAAPGYAQQEAEPSNVEAAPLPDRGLSFDAIHALLAERVDIGGDRLGYVTLIRDAD